MRSQIRVVKEHIVSLKKKRSAQSAFINPRILITLTACGALTGTLLAFLHAEAPANVSQRTLTFAERVGYERAIEDVYWRHRIWPKENPNPKPPLDAVMSQAQLENKVAGYCATRSRCKITGSGPSLLSSYRRR
jgi:hypothetical protein